MIGKERIQTESFVVFSTDIGMKFGMKKKWNFYFEEKESS